jgi:hypothetical protein
MPHCFTFSWPFRAAAVPSTLDRFEWWDEGRSKWGWWSNSTEAGASIDLRIPCLPGGKLPLGRNTAKLSRSVLLGIGCMRSRSKPVGAARVECIAGCSCNATVLDAAWDHPVSLTSIFSLPVRVTSDECSLRFQVCLLSCLACSALRSIGRSVGRAVALMLS